MPDEGVRLRIRVSPRAKTERIETDGETVSVWVTAPPIDGRANEQVIKVLAAALHVRSSSLSIVGGTRGRWKWMQIMGTTEEELGRRLKALTAIL